jgi:hypothetical protein
MTPSQLAPLIRLACNPRESEITDGRHTVGIIDRGDAILLRLGNDRRWIVLQPSRSFAHGEDIQQILVQTLAGGGSRWMYTEPATPSCSSPWAALRKAGRHDLAIVEGHADVPRDVLLEAAEAVHMGVEPAKVARVLKDVQRRALTFPGAKALLWSMAG